MEPLTQNPRSEAAARCLYELSLSSPPSVEALDRLAELERAEPASAWLSLYLAKVRWRTARAEAETLYRRAAERALAAHDLDAEVQARSALYYVLKERGLSEAAQEEARRALVAAQALGQPLALARARVALADLASARGEDLDSAYRELVAVTEDAAADPALWRLCQELLANLALRTGRFTDAHQAYERLAEAAVQSGNRAWEANARYGQARLLFDQLTELPTSQGRKELLALAATAAATAEQARRPDIEAPMLWMLGALSSGEAARLSLERCFARARGNLLRSYCRSARARWLAGSSPAAARAALDEAQALAEQSEDIFAKTAVWQERLRLAWDLEPPAEARAQSWAALDAIEALRNQQAGSASQPGLFSTWAEAYYNFSGRLLAEGLPIDLAEGFRVIEHLRARSLIDALLLTSRADPHPTVELAALQAALGADQALLSFQVAPWRDFRDDWGGGAWLLVATREQARAYRLPDRGETRLAQHLLAGLVPGRDGGELEAAASMYQRWLKPALAELPGSIRRLVIVPDDALHHLPFAALPPAAGQPPLAARFELSFVPSATLWLRLRQRLFAPAEVPALVLADPLASGSAALPFARREAAAVRRHLGREVRRLTGTAASEDALMSAPLRDLRVLHFAAHATVDAVQPERSFVALAAGGDRDGRLEADEIAALHLSGQLVVLSSCDSAGGALLRGEGVLSLARAFFLAGARTVVATLWPLRDDDGAALFERFYAHLADGSSVAAALSLAQRDRLAAGAPSEAWAGVIALGDGELVPFSGGTQGPTSWPLVAMVVGLLGLASLWVKRRWTGA